MLFINADDWGRSIGETDAALKCYRAGRITSVSTMVFMADSDRAAVLATENNMDVGLHLNFSDPFTGKSTSATLNDYHQRIVSFLKINKYAQILYNPFLQEAFAYSCKAQLDEFIRLFGTEPSHFDGHHHMHLCANVLFARMIPARAKVRRSFSFGPGEKTWLNRGYRSLIDSLLGRRYRLTDYFFDLSDCIKRHRLETMAALSRSCAVELMTHPVVPHESEFLLGDKFFNVFSRSILGEEAHLAGRMDQTVDLFKSSTCRAQANY